METIKIRFDLDLPVDATDEQISEWVHFELIGGSIKNINPLSEYEIEAKFMSIDWEYD